MDAVSTLLEGILDYAGLFPPAKLDMASTVRNYAAYRRGADSWFLGRLVVPVARLEEFEEAAKCELPRVEGPGHDDTWPLTALTAPANDAQFAADIERIERFNERHAALGAGSALIDCLEVKVGAAGDIDAALDRVPDELFPYFELPFDRDPRGFVTALAGLDAGAKIRTGGLTADAHPSVEEVARFLVACAGADVPFKATAGLHHPLRHLARDVSESCRQHGFLNVFFGAALLWLGRVDEASLTRLLAEERADSLRATDDGLHWTGAGNSERLGLALGELRAARDEFAHAFGSCSFDEPLADLRSLGLLQPETAAR